MFGGAASPCWAPRPRVAGVCFHQGYWLALNACTQARSIHASTHTHAAARAHRRAHTHPPRTAAPHRRGAGCAPPPGRRTSKIVSVLTSFFTASYVRWWGDHMGCDAPLRATPAFDGRAVCYPTAATLRDYLSWRQADCHINNQVGARPTARNPAQAGLPHVCLKPFSTWRVLPERAARPQPCTAVQHTLLVPRQSGRHPVRGAAHAGRHRRRLQERAALLEVWNKLQRTAGAVQKGGGARAPGMDCREQFPACLRSAASGPCGTTNYAGALPAFQSDPPTTAA